MPDLTGQRIVITRAAHQAEELAGPLRTLGAEVLLVPVIGIAPPADPVPLQNAARDVDHLDWVIFTSANAVDAFAARLAVHPGEVRAKIAAIGPATAARARSRGFAIHVTPEESVSERLAEALKEETLQGKKILLPTAAVTREVLAEGLRRSGAEVRVVEAYRNVIPDEAVQMARRVFKDPLPDWVTFASPSAVKSLVAIVGAHTLRACKLASIGPVTTKALAQYDLRADVEAQPQTIRAMAAVIAGFCVND